VEDREALEVELRARFEAGAFSDVTAGIVRGYGPEILRFLVTTMRDQANAEDAFSSFCEHVLRGLPAFQARSSFRTWAYVIARNEARQLELARGRRGRREVVVPEDFAISAIAEVVRTETAAFLRTEKKTRFAQLRDALPEEDRALLLLRIDRGLEWPDIARILLGDGDSAEPDASELKRRAARLRKRFQSLKERLVELGKREGLLGGGDVG